MISSPHEKGRDGGAPRTAGIFAVVAFLRCPGQEGGAGGWGQREQCGAGPGGPGPAPSTARAAGGGRLSHRNVGGSASSPAP